jgi:hypothetical protein
MTKIGIVTWLFSCLLIAYLSFGLGLRAGQRVDEQDTKVAKNSVQALLAFNRVQDVRRWEGLLTRGCTRQAIRALDIAQDKETELVAEFFRGKIEPSVAKYIKNRDSGFLEKLKSFKSKYGDRWYEEEC